MWRTPASAAASMKSLWRARRSADSGAETMKSVVTPARAAREARVFS